MKNSIKNDGIFIKVMAKWYKSRHRYEWPRVECTSTAVADTADNAPAHSVQSIPLQISMLLITQFDYDNIYITIILNSLKKVHPIFSTFSNKAIKLH